MLRTPPPPPRAAARAAFALRRRLLRAADAAIPPNLAMWHKTMGIARTHVIAGLAELGVPDALGTGRATAAELAPRVGADADTLHRALRAAADEGLVRIDRRGRFRLTRLGRVLREEDAHSVRAWARYVGLGSTTTAWGGFTDSLRTGAPSFKAVHGTVVWDHFAAHPEEERLFAAAMRRLTEEEAWALAPAYPWPETGIVCDIAGGVGTLLGEILLRRPALRGVLVEAPGVLAEAEEHLRGVGVRERVELVAGDLFAPPPVAADLYTLKSILHDWGDEACVGIVSGIRAVMPGGSRLVVLELDQEPNDSDPLASWADLQMLTQCEGGRERSPAELQGLLRDAGLTPGTVRLTAVGALVDAVAG